MKTLNSLQQMTEIKLAPPTKVCSATPGTSYVKFCAGYLNNRFRPAVEVKKEVLIGVPEKKTPNVNTLRTLVHRGYKASEQRKAEINHQTSNVRKPRPSLQQCISKINTEINTEIFLNKVCQGMPE